MANWILYVGIIMIVLVSIIILFIGVVFYSLKSKYKNKALILELKSNGLGYNDTYKYGYVNKRGKQNWRMYKNFTSIFNPTDIMPIPNNFEITDSNKKGCNVCLFIALDRETFIPQNIQLLQSAKLFEKVKAMVTKHTERKKVKIGQQVYEDEFIQVTEKHYVPLAFAFGDINTAELTGNFQMAKEFYSQAHKKHADMLAEESWWEQNRNHVVFITTIVICMIIIILVLNWSGDTAATKQVVQQQASSGIFDKGVAAVGAAP